MVQRFALALDQAVQQIWAFALNFVPLLALVSLAVAVIALVLYLRDREGFERCRKAFLSRVPGFAIGVLVVAVLWLEVFLLGVAKETLLERQSVEASSPYASTAEAPVGTLYQYGPVAAYLQERVFTRTTVLPAQIIPKGQLQQYQTIAPSLLEEQAPYMAKAPKVEVTVRRVGEELLLMRKVTMVEENPITFERAQVHARFEIQRGARNRHYYRLTFEGHYTFRNPLDTEMPGRFVFPLPEPPGTIEGVPANRWKQRDYRARPPRLLQLGRHPASRGASDRSGEVPGDGRRRLALRHRVGQASYRGFSAGGGIG